MKALACLLILATLLTILPKPVQASTSARAIQDARNDAEREINKELWFMTGCCLSGLGYTIAFLITPELPVQRFMGQPPEYVFFYIGEYERKTKRLQAYYTFWGSLTGFGVLAIFSLLRATS